MGGLQRNCRTETKAMIVILFLRTVIAYLFKDEEALDFRPDDVCSFLAIKVRTTDS